MNAFLLSTWLAISALAGPPVDSTKSPHNGQVPAPVGDKAPEVDSNAVHRMGDTVQLVGGGPRSEVVDEFVAMMGAGPPENDSHKWFISVISMRGCSHCSKLKADWATAPQLLAFANPNDSKTSWAHLNFYMIEDKSQEWRWKGLKLTSFPTVLIQPPRDGSYGNPSTVVGQLTGYSSPDQLASEMTKWFKAYIAKHSEKKRADLGPVRNGIGQTGQIGLDPPWAPTPKVEPSVPTTPVVPLFPFTIEPKSPNAPTDPQVDQSVPEVVVVTDDGGDALNDSRFRRFVNSVQSGQRNSRVRLVDFSAVKDRFKLNKNDLPAVVVTDAEGRVVDKMSGRILPYIREVGIGDLPWSSFLMLLTSGFSMAAVIPIARWAVTKIRAARVASGTAIITDDQFKQLADFIEARVKEMLDKK